VQTRRQTDHHVPRRLLRLGPRFRGGRALQRPVEAADSGLQDSGRRGFGIRHRPGIPAAAEVVAEGETGRRCPDLRGDNDRLDNMTSHRYDHYQKPYFATQPDGSLVLRGQPVPRSHLLYYRDDWLVQNLWLARLATNIYLRLAHPKADVPDPTEKIIARI